MKFKWNESAESAFQELKSKVNSDIAIYLPNFDKEFVLTTDASNSGVGAVIQQELDNELVVIDWASKRLSDAEKKLSITEKEFLAMCWGIEHFNYYLKGRKFKIITDHSALDRIPEKEIVGNLKLERMRENIQQYNYEVFYKKGELLYDADAISRIYEKESDQHTEQAKFNKNILKGEDGKSSITKYLKHKSNCFQHWTKEIIL